MAAGVVAHGVLTFVFTDISGSTRLWERVPVAMQRALARHDAILRTSIEAHHGRVFKTVGDEFCSAFETPIDALRAAIDVQRALRREPWPEEVGALTVRIGIHTGEAIAADGDFFGATLNRVARLMSAGSGGQILISADTAELVRDAFESEFQLRDLGAHRLRDLAEPQTIYQVIAAGLLADFAQLATLDAHPNNLPSQISSFVGREEELQQLRELISASRLVTVCGAGGIGKTRLALQIAADTIGRYKDGSWMVALADIEDARLVPQTVGAVLHVQEAPGEAMIDTLLHRLGTRQMFLVLDNAEHVLGETAKLARSILNACPGVAMLVTSREPLHVNGERVLRIGPMDDEDAAQLFAERADLTGTDASVQSICRKLDGVPLAIELVAARAGALTTSELEQHLNTILHRLRSKDPTLEIRHRTLRATIDWSYRLLDEREQRLFTHLAIFDASFSLDACEQIAAEGRVDAMELLDALVDKSFVVSEPRGRYSRYRLLEILQEFACEKIEETGESAAIAARQFAYYKAQAERWGSWESEEEEREYLAAMAEDMPNTRAALEWGFEQHDKTPAFEFLQKVAPYWQQRCNIDEARSWFSRALAIEDGAAEGALRASMLRRAATLATIEDDYGAARLLTQRALRIFQDLDDKGGTAEAQHNLAVIEHRSGSAQLAHELYARALEGFVQTGHTIGQITALYNLGQVSLECGDLVRAKTYLEQGVALCGGSAEHADRFATFLSALGDVALRRGEFDESERYYTRALRMKRELGDQYDEVEVLRCLAALAIRRGNYDEALHYARESLSIARELKISSVYVGCFEVFAVIFMATAQHELAGGVLLSAEVLRRKIGYVYNAINELAPDIEAIRSGFSDGEIERAVAQSDAEDVMRLIGSLLEN